jgi:hypothetical protein
MIARAMELADMGAAAAPSLRPLRLCGKTIMTPEAAMLLVLPR